MMERHAVCQQTQVLIRRAHQEVTANADAHAHVKASRSRIYWESLWPNARLYHV